MKKRVLILLMLTRGDNNKYAICPEGYLFILALKEVVSKHSKPNCRGEHMWYVAEFLLVEIVH